MINLLRHKLHTMFGSLPTFQAKLELWHFGIVHWSDHVSMKEKTNHENFPP